MARVTRVMPERTCFSGAWLNVTKLLDRYLSLDAEKRRVVVVEGSSGRAVAFAFVVLLPQVVLEALLEVRPESLLLGQLVGQLGNRRLGNGRLGCWSSSKRRRLAAIEDGVDAAVLPLQCILDTRGAEWANVPIADADLSESLSVDTGTCRDLVPFEAEIASPPVHEIGEAGTCGCASAASRHDAESD